MAAKLGTRVLIGIPTLRSARRSCRWIEGLCSIQMPLGSSLGRVWIEDETIANARNQLCEAALEQGVDYLFMLGDDVVPPPNVLLAMLDKIGREYPDGQGGVARASMITGVYWTKTVPTEPYLWQGLLRGSYRDWTAGEFFPVDLAGCDCLMIETALLRELPRPWFSTEWVWEEGQPPSPIATEDFYFYTKARRRYATEAREVKPRLFADTSIQCLHEERSTGQLFGLAMDMPQAGGVPEGAAGLRIAELGAGMDSPTWDADAVVTRFDADPAVRPDIRCDLRSIPDWQFGRYDLVHSRHVLEHFGRAEAPALIRHWAKLLRVGGELVVRVPNLDWALARLAEHAETPAGGNGNGGRVAYAWQQMYGAQQGPLDYHKNGFTARKLAALLGTHPCLDGISVAEEDEGQNLCARAVLAREDLPEAIGPWWAEIEAAGREAPRAPEDVESAEGVEDAGRLQPV